MCTQINQYNLLIVSLPNSRCSILKYELSALYYSNTDHPPTDL